MEKLRHEEMLVALSAVLQPAGKGFSSRQIDGYLLSFCASCPDPAGAMDLVIHAPRGSTVEQIIRQALAVPEYAVESWSEDELAFDCPLHQPIFSRRG